MSIYEQIHEGWSYHMAWEIAEVCDKNWVNDELMMYEWCGNGVSMMVQRWFKDDSKKAQRWLKYGSKIF